MQFRNKRLHFKGSRRCKKEEDKQLEEADRRTEKLMSDKTRKADG